METILIQTANEKELKLVQSFLSEHKLKSRILSDENKEDIVLGNLMQETDYNDIVDTNEFIKKLRN